MPSSRFHYLIRRSHRFLGICIGVQFLAWTLGGLYFSWSDMDEVHGDYELNHEHALPDSGTYISPSLLFDSIRINEPSFTLTDLRLIKIIDQPHWRATYEAGHDKEHKDVSFLYDAVSGEYRPPLSEEEAIAVAKKQYLGKGEIQSVRYLTSAGKVHEYREQPLPAYAVTFNDKRHTTFYVASELGVITKARNMPWRQFDFLWMLHTMDYGSRDNITNWLLRIFSIFGLITVLSGFTLFFVSLRKKKSL